MHHSLFQCPDILLRVIELCDIDTLLSLRLMNREIHHLISLYESSIAQAVARVTFPTSGLLLRPPSDGKLSIRWLIGLIPKQLAAIAVERWHLHSFPNYYVIFSENPLGDPVRKRVERGWRILQKLSLIARDVDAISNTDLLLSKYERKVPLFDLTRRKRELEIMVRREHLVTKIRLDYCQTLESADVVDYRLMEFFVDPCIRNVKWYLRDLACSRFNWTQPLRNEQKKAESMMNWMKWFILKEGPSLFWKQWWRRSEINPQVFDGDRRVAPGLSALDRMLQAYHSRSKEQIKIEAEAASCITSFLEENRGTEDEIEYLDEMRMQREHLEVTGQAPPYVAHTMGWVPFLFEQCPLTHLSINLNGSILSPNWRIN